MSDLYLINSINQLRRDFYQSFVSEKSSTSQKVGYWLGHKGLTVISVPSNLVGAALGSVGMALSACTVGALKIVIFILTFGKKGHFSSGFDHCKDLFTLSVKEMSRNSDEVQSDLNRIHTYFTNLFKKPEKVLPKGNRDLISLLPPDMLNEIFKNLDLKSVGNVAAVCKLFQKRINDPIVQAFILENYAKQFPLKAPPKISRLAELKVINLSNNDINDSQFVALTKFLTRFEVVNISSCHSLSSKTICQSFKGLKDLREISLPPKVDTEDMKEIIRACSHLQKMDVWGYGVDHTVLDLLCQQLPHLKSLKLGFCLLKDSLKSIPNELEELVIHQKDIKDEEIEKNIHKLAKIKYLDLSTSQMTEKSLTKILDCCHHLTGIKFTNCPNLTEEAIQSAKCRNLTSIGFSKISDVTFKYLLERSSAHLKELKAIDSELTLKDIYVNVPTLEVLDLSGNTKIDPNGFKALLQGFKNLKHLQLNKCNVEALTALSDLGKIESLQLKGYNVSAEILIPILKPNLRTLHLGDLNDEAIEKIAPFLSHLQNFTMVSSLMTSKSLKTLSKHLKTHYIYFEVSKTNVSICAIMQFKLALPQTKVSYRLK